MKNSTEPSHGFNEELPAAFGLGRPTSDHGAPPVDEVLLRQYKDRKLDRTGVEAVASLIAKYSSWHDAFEKTVRNRE